jgi:hypothetical protein
MRTNVQFLVPIGVWAVTAACTNAGARESTISGTAALTTFQAAPTAMAARDEVGRVVRGPIDAQGKFALPLAKGHTYRLALEGGGASVPIVFPRSSGTLDATFVLKTNGAALRLGQVRRYASAPGSGFHVLAAIAPASPPGASAPGGECIDCVNDDQQVTCDASESDGTESATESDGTSAGRTVGPDLAEQADPSGELAVGDQNVPEEVAGCDSQKGDNVDQQQEGEH